MSDIKLKIEHLERIQKQKLELQEKLNQTDDELKKLVDEVISFNKQAKKPINKLHDFLGFFFLHVRNLNSALAFWGICITCVILILLKKELSDTFFVIGALISAVPLILAIIDIFCSIFKVKSKFTQVLLLFFPFLAYLLVVVNAVIIFYDSFDVTEKLLQMQR